MDAQASAALARRYGGGPKKPRRAQVAVLALLLLGGICWAVWAGLAHAHKDVTWQVDTFATSERSVVISFTIHRSGDFPVTCSFRARGRDGAFVGHGSLELPVSRRPTVSSVYTLATSATPVTGEIDRCARVGDR
ncbi:MAG: hypothetical protein QOK42_2333 [Frankiaceae bacterium]|jgi:hypothetical protein|nr:hypothetical protein [Frankiaceae bacterium]MDX6273085.1 hypothetical protein [Frankiales bacterium]